MKTWNDSMSDGCSVPKALRWIVREETLRERGVCVAHDKAYYHGGSPLARLRADIALRNGLIGAGMNKALAWGYFLAVRVGGHPAWRWSNTSWAFGNKIFKYEQDTAI